MRLQQANDIAAHDLADVGFGESCLLQSVGDLYDAGDVERSRHRTVIVRSQPDVINSDQVDCVTDGPGDRFGILSANRRLPETNATTPPVFAIPTS